MGKQKKAASKLRPKFRKKSFRLRLTEIPQLIKNSKPVSIKIPRVKIRGKERAFRYPETSKSNPLVIAGRF